MGLWSIAAPSSGKQSRLETHRTCNIIGTSFFPILCRNFGHCCTQTYCHHNIALSQSQLFAKGFHMSTTANPAASMEQFPASCTRLRQVMLLPTLQVPRIPTIILTRRTFSNPPNFVKNIRGELPSTDSNNFVTMHMVRLRSMSIAGVSLAISNPEVPWANLRLKATGSEHPTRTLWHPNFTSMWAKSPSQCSPTTNHFASSNPGYSKRSIHCSEPWLFVITNFLKIYASAGPTKLPKTRLNKGCSQAKTSD